MEYESPFDQASSRPLLVPQQENGAKTPRWLSFWNQHSNTDTKRNTTATTTVTPLHQGRYQHKLNAVPVTEIQFVRNASDNDDKNDDNDWLELLEEGSLVQGQDLDTAVVQERHQDIQGVHEAMVQINQIQKGMRLFANKRAIFRPR